MCATCTTAIDAAATNAVLVAAVAANSWDRVRDRLRRRPRIERELENWEANARFVSDLGLDPLTTLGAPPSVPHDAEPLTRS